MATDMSLTGRRRARAPRRCRPAAPRRHQAETTAAVSGFAKSSPLKSSRRLLALASAYAAQSPKFNRAAWRPLPKRRNAYRAIRGRPPECAGQGCQLVALVLKPVDKAPADDAVPAFPCDVVQDRSEIRECGIKQDKAAHSVAGLGQFGRLCVQCSGKVIFGVDPAFGDRAIQGVAQRPQPGLALLDQGQPFAHFHPYTTAAKNNRRNGSSVVPSGRRG